MQDYLGKLDKDNLRILKAIGQQADKRPANAYVVGGPVRDILLGRKILDIDVVVEGDAIILAKQYAAQFGGSVLVHDRFATATVGFKDGRRIDFAMARKEDYPHPGSLPVVKAGFIDDDLFRRDFTINAMAIRINQDRFGQLVDEFSGYKDLKDRKIRILHDRSFMDDPTRILRAIRFEQRLNFKLEVATETLLKSALKKDYPESVKAERYFAEFRKLLREPSPKRCLMRLDQLGGLAFLGMKHKIDARLLAVLEYNIRLFIKRYKVDKSQAGDVLYLMSLVQGWNVRRIERLGQKFNLRRSEREALLRSPFVKKAYVFLSRGDIKPSEVWEVLKSLSYEVVVYLRNFQSHKTVQRHVDDFLQKYQHVSLGINGRDLKSLGLSSGSKMKEVLKRLLSEKIDGRIKSYRDERRRAKAIIQNFN